MDAQTQMTLNIVEAVNTLFDEESEMKRYDLPKLDLTQFFTAYVQAGTYIYNKLTEEDKNSLEFTHLANQLVVQDMLEKKVEVVDDEEV
jgi:hypothetical protein